MRFQETRVLGAYVIRPEPRADPRGSFARAWCEQEFAAHGLNPRIAQVNFSFNLRKGTVRGLHLQLPPFEEAKTVVCVRGSIFDVVVDLRPQSPTYLSWDAAHLSGDAHEMLHIPEGCAHGLQTLEDSSEVLYLISQFYSPEHARGYRHDDPSFGVEWPSPVSCISDVDRGWPPFDGPARTGATPRRLDP